MMEENKIKISWYGKHFGEEPPLVGPLETPANKERNGSGTIFLSGCNMHCVFCQNWQISQKNEGNWYSIEQASEIMLNLQYDFAVNINLVTPTIWWKSLIEVITLAKKNGLSIPVVWNSNGFEKIDIIKEFDGLVDIYLPDYKYSDNNIAYKYSKTTGYQNVADKAIREMYKQAGLLEIENGCAKKGLIIRHLILPGNIQNTLGVLERIADINNRIHLSLMSQYYPSYKSSEYPELTISITEDEFHAAEDKMEELGIENGWVQQLESRELFVPDFKSENPFKDNNR